MKLRYWSDDFISQEANRVLGGNKYVLYDSMQGYRLYWRKPDEYEMVDRFTFAYKSIRREGDFLARWADTKDFREIESLLNLS